MLIFIFPSAGTSGQALTNKKWLNLDPNSEDKKKPRKSLSGTRLVSVTEEAPPASILCDNHTPSYHSHTCWATLGWQQPLRELQLLHWVMAQAVVGPAWHTWVTPACWTKSEGV